MIDILWTLSSLAFILGACFVFSNAVEWLGKLLRLNQGVTGSVLAAAGTALPETIIPIIAILFYHNPEAADIGIGAIIGAPFMLGTLAFFITGLSIGIFTLTGRRDFKVHAERSTVRRDLTFFLMAYSLAIVATVFSGYHGIRIVIALLLLAIYGLYLRRTFAAEGANIEELGDLYFARWVRREPSRALVFVQLAIGLLGIIAGAHFFIQGVERLAHLWQIPALVLSIIITPIATELPEKLNSVIWTRQRKDTLALGNISGAMVFQSCIPTAFGIAATAWKLDHLTLLCAILALTSAAMHLLYLRFRPRLSPVLLMVSGLGYGIFIWGVIGF